MINSDNIVAISTPPGEGGIAIIRLSGDNVIDIVNEYFLPYKKGVILKDRPSYTMTLGYICDQNKVKIDEVLISIMRTPRTYTGENLVEVNCHGGTLAARRCLDVFLKAGARIADAGEFTKRAFLNGRLDLSQAEAVVDIIRAKSEKAMHLALLNLQGQKQGIVNEIEDKLTRLKAMVEASVDFPDEVGDLDQVESKELLDKLIIKLNKLLEAGKKAEIYRDGVKVVICGKPNVGKSSLLNALLKKEKAIVTNIPGTTRDVIEEYIQIKGIPVKLMDTAGIRVTEDYVESIGVDRSKQVIEEADLAVLVLDVETGISQEDIIVYESLKNKSTIILINKEDLEKKNIHPKEIEEKFAGTRVIRASVIEDMGINELEDSIEEIILKGIDSHGDIEIMLNLRQKNALDLALQHIKEIQETMSHLTLDCLAVDISAALEAIGEISGKSLNDDAIERIFHDFCIGK